MDFEFSDDQRLLRDGLDRLLKDHYDFDRRKAYVATPEGWSREQWERYAEMGLLALPFAEDDGGLNGGPVDTMLVMEALGGALALEPYFATVVLGGGLVRLGGNAAQRAALVPQIAAGDLLLAFAQAEAQSRYDLADVATTARRDGDGWVLDGAKRAVLHGDTADKLFVTARTAGSRRDRGGIGLFLVDATAAGVSRRGYPTQDGLRAADVTFANVRVDANAVFGDPSDALPLVERVVDAGLAALTAEAVGVMTRAHEITVEYMKVRKQFGVTIGSFQALQHRAVDMLVLVEQARSMAYYATMMSDAADPAERRRAIAAARVQAGKSGRFVGDQTIQLHGGIGMTEECQAGHYYRRLTMLELAFGDTAHHLARLARDGGLAA